MEMWNTFTPVLEYHLFDPESEWHIDPRRIAFIIPYRAMLLRAEEDLKERGIEIAVGLPDDAKFEHLIQDGQSIWDMKSDHPTASHIDARRLGG